MCMWPIKFDWIWIVYIALMLPNCCVSVTGERWHVRISKVCVLTLGLLALAWGSPSDAWAMFVQVEQSHQPLGTSLQLHHLCPRLHGTHTSLHCRETEMQTQTSIAHHDNKKTEESLILLEDSDLGWSGLNWDDLGWSGLNWAELGWSGMIWARIRMGNRDEADKTKG